MFEKLDVLRMAQALAVNAGARMGAIAGNIANADTPGYKARDLPDFATTYSASEDGMRATRPGHFGADPDDAAPQPVIRQGVTAPNGNSVSLEHEMVMAAEVRQQHDMALSVYRASNDILRTALGRN